MNRLLPMSLFGAVVALTFAATAASATPPVNLHSNARQTTANSGGVDLVHYRGWRHRHWFPRRCHWERACWWDRWGHRRCEWVRRCHGPRW